MLHGFLRSFCSLLYIVPCRDFRLGACVGLLQVGRVQVVLEPDEVLLDTPCRYKAVEDGHAAGLVVCATGTRATEWLLSDNSTRALLVVVDVAGGVAQPVRRLQQSLAVGGKAGRTDKLVE